MIHLRETFMVFLYMNMVMLMHQLFVASLITEGLSLRILAKIGDFEQYEEEAAERKRAELLERKRLKKLRQKELKEKEQAVNVESVDSGLSSTDFSEEGSLTAAELSPSSSSFEHDMSSREKSGHIGSTDNDLESRASQSSSARIPVYPELDCDNHQEVQHKTNVDRKSGEVESENLFTEPWSERCDIAFPCASQNELNHADALNLVNSGCRILTEGSNMPCTAEAVDVLRKSKVLVGPG